MENHVGNSSIILEVDDYPDIAFTLKRFLENRGYTAKEPSSCSRTKDPTDPRQSPARRT